MKGTAVQFGAGNIGRGFLAQLFHENGLEVVFVDVAVPIIDALNSRGSYTIEIVGPNAQKVPITDVRAIHGSDRVRVAGEIAKAEIVCTAVGVNALPHIAPALAAGLLARYKSVGAPLNILLCENWHDCASKVRDLVAEHLPEKDRAKVLANTGWVQAVVSRMVPAQTDEERRRDPLSIRVEAYKRLPIDARSIVGEFPVIAGVEPTLQFEASVEQKLYIHNCAHALLGYLGYLAGHEYGFQALRDERILALLRAVLAETGQSLIRKHGFDPHQMQGHIEDLLERFQNEALGDTCRRLAKDPVRKLAPDDRLVGAARLCESQGIIPRALSWAIAAALRYDDPEDPSAPALQESLRTSGQEAVLNSMCGIRPGEPLSRLIEEAQKAVNPMIVLGG